MSDAIVRIEGLHFGYGGQDLLRDVTADIPSGCVCGVVGSNGVGKTTLIKLLLGRLVPRCGYVTVFGLDPVANPAEVLGQIGYLSEDRDMPNWMQVGEFVRYIQAFYPNWDHAYSRELIDAFELPIDARIETLSRGQRARVGLVAALAHRPPLLILDEPSAGLDAVVRRDILNAVVRVAADEGRTVVFSSHLLGELERVSDRIIVVEDGTIAVNESVAKLLGSHVQLQVSLPEVSNDWYKDLPLLSAYPIGKDWDVIVTKEFLHTIKHRLLSLSGKITREGPPRLEELFVAFSKSNRSPAGEQR